MTNTQPSSLQPGNVIVTTGGRRLLLLEVTEAVAHYDVLTPEGNRTFVRHWASRTTLDSITARVEAAR